jgi:hypothetical protein
MPRAATPPWDLTQALVAGKTLRDEYRTYKVSLVDAAPLVLTTGKIVACDPFTAWNPSPFARTVRKGRYPVTLSIAKIGKDTRVGLAMVRFRKGDVAGWEMATKRGQTIAKLKPGHSYGYGVDAGAGCFADAAAFANLELIDRIERENGGDEGWLLPRVQQRFFADNWAAAVLDAKTKANVVLFASGWGDGFYTSWWGLSKRRDVVCLVTDFGVYPISGA